MVVPVVYMMNRCHRQHSFCSYMRTAEPKPPEKEKAEPEKTRAAAGPPDPFYESY
ncbi:hypothetical protein HMPREF9413_0795 [Paenibacillus sp. HGF7]|nr:hypothetical protein HMPREF9413_0795 [Paenibacillus sp. HGF7]